MKAFRIFEPGITGITEEPEIDIIEDDEVLLRLVKVGFCGSDLSTFRGLNPNVSYPRIPGHEIAAVVIRKGKDVPDSITGGQRVSVLPYTSCGKCSSCLCGRTNACKDNQTLGVQREGAMTEYITAPYTKLITGVDELSFSDIALIEPLSVGFHAARRAEVSSGEYVLVFGCGLVGLGVISRAAGAGGRVIAVDIDDDKLKLAEAMGASYVINSRTEKLIGRVSAITGGHGPAAVIEAIGLNETYLASIELAAYCGRVVYVGYAKMPIEYDTKQFILKELQIRGSRNAERKDFEDVLSYIADGKIPVNKLVSDDVTMEQAGKALVDWSADPGSVSKILVTIADEKSI